MNAVTMSSLAFSAGRPRAVMPSKTAVYNRVSEDFVQRLLGLKDPRLAKAGKSVLVFLAAHKAPASAEALKDAGELLMHLTGDIGSRGAAESFFTDIQSTARYLREFKAEATGHN